MYINAFEIIIIFIFGSIICIVFTKWLSSKKYGLLSTILAFPAIFFSICGASRIVTADEHQYIYAYSNMQNATNSLYVKSQFLSKNLYQYRTTQMVLGRLFNFLRGLGLDVNSTIGRQGYKLAHWFFCALMIVVIIYVIWRWYLPDKSTSGLNGSILLGLISILLFALPVNILMCKVANYDGTSVFPSIIAILLAGVYINYGNRCAAIFGIIFAYLGAIEKSSAAPWFCVAVTLIIFGVLYKNRNKSAIKNFFYVSSLLAIILSLCVLFSLFNLAYILSYAQKSDLDSIGIKLNFSMVVFPFVFLYQILLTGKLTMDSFNVKNPYLALLFTGLTILIAAYMLYSVYWIASKHKKRFGDIYKKLDKAYAILLLCILITSVVGAYFIPVMSKSFIPINPGYYEPTKMAATQIYHYGAKTALGHNLYAILNHYGVIVTSLPTTIFLIMCILNIVIWRGKSSWRNMFIKLLLPGCLLLPVIFAIGGQPQGARYYGVVINLVVISSIVILYLSITSFKVRSAEINDDNFTAQSVNNKRVFSIVNKLKGIKKYIQKSTKVRIQLNNILVYRFCLAGVIVAVLFIFFELSQYYPNVICFSPTWLVRSSSLNAYPEQGVWHAGETMCWGEDYTYASRTINKYYNENGMADKKYNIYSNYGYRSYGEINAKLCNLDENSFTEDTWISLSRFSLYRKPLPNFLLEVEPFFKIEFRGMTAVYIYRGDQLYEYKDSILT